MHGTHYLFSHGGDGNTTDGLIFTESRLLIGRWQNFDSLSIFRLAVMREQRMQNHVMTLKVYPTYL